MTRINLIDPSHLTKRHLIAEYKEITQFLHNVKKSNLKDLPKNFTMGTGHVKFFYNKGEYIFDRFCSLKEELIKRSIKIDEEKFSDRLNEILNSFDPNRGYNNYKPCKLDYLIVIERIKLRINEKPHLYPDSQLFFNNLEGYL